MTLFTSREPALRIKGGYYQNDGRWTVKWRSEDYIVAVLDYNDCSYGIKVRRPALRFLGLTNIGEGNDIV